MRGSSPRMTSSDCGDPMNSPQRSFASRLLVFVPYLWLLLFFLIPVLIVLKISLSQTAIAQPPYEPVWEWSAEGIKSFIAALSFSNYASLFSDSLYVISYLKSLQI